MEIDRVPVSQLPSRYGIARSALYTHLKDLKIEPEKQGKKAFVNANQLEQLDALHSHIQKGGTTGEFLKQQSSLGELPTADSPFSDAGFTFTRAGKRKGGELAWSVGKPKRGKS